MPLLLLPGIALMAWPGLGKRSHLQNKPAFMVASNFLGALNLVAALAEEKGNQKSNFLGTQVLLTALETKKCNATEVAGNLWGALRTAAVSAEEKGGAICIVTSHVLETQVLMATLASGRGLSNPATKYLTINISEALDRSLALVAMVLCNVKYGFLERWCLRRCRRWAFHGRTFSLSVLLVVSTCIPREVFQESPVVALASAMPPTASCSRVSQV